MGILTITTDAGQDTRIVAAYKDKLGTIGNPTNAQIKADVVAYLTRTVLGHETKVAQAAALASVTPIAPT